MGEKLGMIGLGKMGLPPARNLIADGHAVCGYDVDSTRMNLLEDGESTCSMAPISGSHNRVDARIVNGRRQGGRFRTRPPDP